MDDQPEVPRSPTGRVPQWVLDEAAGRATSPVPFRDWVVDEPPSLPPRRRRGRRLLGLLVVVALVAGGAWLAGYRLPGTAAPAAPAAATDPGPATGRPTPRVIGERPTPGFEEAAEPLGRPAPVSAGGGAVGFEQTQPDGSTPVAYDPCRPVHYVIDPARQPEGGEAVVQDAVARVSAVTGLRFVYDGPTDEAIDPQRPPFQPERYGDRWAPVLVTWDTPAENPDLAGDVSGTGGSSWVALGAGPSVYVTGMVSLDAEWAAEALDRRDGEALLRAVVLHELGHVVGLAHVDDPTQLMNPVGSADVLDYAAGDLAGLARLGAGECVPGV